MLKRPAKKELSQEQMQAITQASAKQTGSMSSPKTYDPQYPVFDTPINQKVLIYIPNHTVTDDSGAVKLRADIFTAHAVRMGKAYTDVRCCGEIINPALGWDGTCPLCNATTECWDLYNYQYAEIAKSKGIDKDSPEAEELLKEDRKGLLGNMAIKAAEQWITFPIIVIDCEEGKTIPKRNSNNEISGKPMFYSIRTATYDDKWVKAFDSLEDEDDAVNQNPAGRWAILNFMYTPKTGTHNKRDSARNLSVSFKVMKGYEQWEEYFNKLTEDWTPELAKEVLVRNSIRDMDEMEEACAEIIQPVRDKIAKYELAGTIGGTEVAVATNASTVLENMGAVPVDDGVESDDAGEMPNV